MCNDVLDLNLCIYVVFDLETTGLSRERHHIIEIAASILDCNGVQLPEGTFSSLVLPLSKIPHLITIITGISNEDVSKEQHFDKVGNDFLIFIKQNVTNYEKDNNIKIKHIIFVAHNGIRFDIPFLYQKIRVYNIELFYLMESKFYILDTIHLSKTTIKEKKLNIPDNYKLSSLFYYCTGKEPTTSHRASGDVDSTINILLFKEFWNERSKHIHKIDIMGTIKKNKLTIIPYEKKLIPNDDSDTDNESDDQSANSSVEQKDDDSNCNENVNEIENNNSNTINIEINEIDNNDNTNDIGWKSDTPFDGVDSESLFMEKMMSRSSTRINDDIEIRIGLQSSKNTVNSPMKAWRQVFTNSILDRIVKYTNEYGDCKLNSWTNIDRTDLTDFISVLFISSIQKRKDRSSHWWSDNPLLESPVIKRLMTGRKFHTILRFLHCCSLENQPNKDDPDYNPAYKIQEIMDLLESRYQRLFIPGSSLSLDESLIRAFGRMKFKVRIITKAARYGIKLYVLTDARTAYVLKVIIYTGKQTYQTYNNDNIEMKKTVQIVRELVEPYINSYRTIYVDRFYTSIDVMKELDKVSLFITGTVMKNRIPKEFVIAKTSKQFKSMKRGDYTYHKYSYVDENKKNIQYGLVAWKDRNMVYMLTNNWATTKEGSCRRRSANGIITLNRPDVIEQYNNFMGGVDLADMRRLHCNSTLMGQNRWWLKLFFYCLDVGSANALVLYREAMENNNKMTIVEFKQKIVFGLVGSRLEDIPKNPITKHELVKTEIRYRCSYCALFSVMKRTRFKCVACNIPLCSIGTCKNNEDCFALSHADENILKATTKKFEAMQTTTNKPKK